MSVKEVEARSFTKNSEDAISVGIALPVRKRSPVDFWMHLYNLMPPLNVRLGYMIQKAAEEHVVDGMLPAAARNVLVERALSRGMDFLFFLDDDVLFPDITLYRMLVQMRKYPEIACTTAVGCTKLTPTEPLIYADNQQGAFWDWHLGAMTPIHSAWAGCMLVNMDYVRKLKEPWFNDVVTGNVGKAERFKRNVWGQDRYFHRQLREVAGGVIMADTGLLVGHYDADLQKAYIIPPDAPCFKKRILGESFVTFYDNDGYVNWRRIILPDMPDASFTSYLDFLQQQSTPEEEIAMVPARTAKVEQREGYTVTDTRRIPEDMPDFGQWFKEIGVGE